jgi:hypothetical protein
MLLAEVQVKIVIVHLSTPLQYYDNKLFILYPSYLILSSRLFTVFSYLFQEIRLCIMEMLF